ncbi:MAG: hypothetical protein ACREJ2_04835, partial [Planctomycetota bacterium]
PEPPPGAPNSAAGSGRGARRFAGRCLLAALLSVATLIAATGATLIVHLLPDALGAALWCAGLALIGLDLPAAALTMLLTRRGNPRAFRRAAAAFGVAVLSLAGHAAVALFAVGWLGRPFGLPSLF